MKVVLFCGGLGTRLGELTEDVPKPLVKIGYRPILWHLMKYYAHYGHKDFILCLGYKADKIKDYFLNYNEYISNDFTMSNGGKDIELQKSDIADWKITFVDTGLRANIGQRLKAVEKYLEGEEMFLANYSDGLTNLAAARDHRLLPGRAARSAASCASSRRTASTSSSSTEDGLIDQHPVRARHRHADQRRVLRVPEGNLRLHEAGRGTGRRAVPAADRGERS